MKPIKVIKDFSVNGNYYFAGDTIENKIDYETLNKINEKGYIEPLTLKELIQYKREFEKPQKQIKNKEEVE